MEKDNVEAWWEKNTPAFYSRYVLPYPTRTVEWLRRREMILGTRAAKNDQNYFILANDARHYDDETLGANREVQLVKKINHDGEVFRARHMPQIPSTIATKTVNAVCVSTDEDDLPGDDSTKGIVHQLENKHLRESKSWVNISAHEVPLKKCRTETAMGGIFGKVWQTFSNVGRRSLCAVYEPITAGRLKEKGVALESCSESLDDGLDGGFVVLTWKNDYPASPHVSILCNKSWQKGDCLGRGHFGNVYECLTKEGSVFAVKEISLPDQDSRGQQSLSHFVQEISFLSRLKHENIVRYFGTYRDDTKLYIFLELVPKGSLAALCGKYKLGDSHVSAYTRQILNGLNYLHCQKVVHRDIKCDNILVDANGSVKLADFGLAKATEQLNAIKSCEGSPRWMAPEVVNPNKHHGYGTAADIWGLGCTVLEMSTGELPYSHLEGAAALFRIGKGEVPPIPNTLSNDAQDFIQYCLQVNPDDRPTAAQLLEHPFVK